MVDQEKVAHANLLKTHTERVDPEAIRMLRVASGDVSCNSLVKAKSAEDTKRCCQALLSVPPLFVERTLLKRIEWNAISHENPPFTALPSRIDNIPIFYGHSWISFRLENSKDLKKSGDWSDSCYGRRSNFLWPRSIRGSALACGDTASNLDV